ncbi:glycosyltransferase [Nesterenkonia halotolerans]|uniref:glycosyltransferase family 2 protein n=1 Tax=Nesterenkonia halotolerans TaxID=225325 RepID=UPI003EE6DF60
MQEGVASPYSLNAEWLGRLGYVVGLQNLRESDTQFALTALDLSIRHSSSSETYVQRFEKLLAELQFELRRFQDVENLLNRSPSLKKHYYSYLSTDVQNPFVRSGLSRGAVAEWLAGFNRQFRENDLVPVEVRKGDETPFNRLVSTPVQGPTQPGPMVTVIMTTYNPVREDVIQSARSILEQTWSNLELLVVDDASPAEYDEVLDEISALDDRVRIIKLEANGGTYAARNTGIAQARGEFITGQDADDWSHPQRIETQVNYLRRNPDRPGNQVYTVNMTEDLVRIRRGYQPFIPSAPTLMVRTHILRELGGYLPARKAADNELQGRVNAYSTRDIYRIPEPLIFMRILPDSLSRADFRPGWQHPARRAFWSSYRNWHSEASSQELRLPLHSEVAPIYVPPRFTAPPEEDVHLDVLFAADWCEFGETQVAALAEISLMISLGYRVGLLHLENSIHLSEHARHYIAPVQELISHGSVALVLADEEFYEVDLALVRDPELLQFMPDGRVNFPVRRVAVVAQDLPVSSGSFEVRYIPEDCARHAENFFGSRPIWVARSYAVAEKLGTFIGVPELSELNYEPVFNSDSWGVPRARPRSRVPVIGRWSGNTARDWPLDRETIPMLWPTDGTSDVRLLGNPTEAVRALGARWLPPTWVSFHERDISRRTYYRSLDFFVHYTGHETVLAVELPVLEALAAGCVVILPPGTEEIYGDAALYAEPQSVLKLINTYYADFHLYLEQSRRGVNFAEQLGDGAGTRYKQLIGRLLPESSRIGQETLS